MNKGTRTFLAVLLALVLTGSVGMFLRQTVQLRAAEERYAQAEAMAAPPDIEMPLIEEPESPAHAAPVDEHAARLLELDSGALQAVNEEVLGWLEIPGTAVSYPLVQGTDNQYYLEHAWDKEPSTTGAVFLEDCAARSVIETRVVPTVHDRILTLSTCTGKGHATRWVVQARLSGDT